MKKVLCLIFAAMLLLQTGCGAQQNREETQMNKTFQVGFGRTDITPTYGVPLSGYGNTHLRISNNIISDLWITCVAIRDAQGNDLLLISQDLSNGYWASEVLPILSSATGIPQDHIMLASTHTHCGPDQTSGLQSIKDWKQEYLLQMTSAAEAALADLAEADIYIGQTKTEDLSFVRHYLMSDGSYAGDNFGDFVNNTIVDHAREVDPQLQVIRFDRSGAGKQNVLMVNWQCHPMWDAGMTRKNVSADFIGTTRDYLEEKTGDLFVYFQGAAGDHSTRSRLPEEVRAKDAAEFGKLLGDCVLEAAGNLKKLDAAPIQVKQTQFEGNINHTMEDKLDLAQEVEDLYRKTDRDTGNKLAWEYGFSSVYHSNAVLRRSKYEATRTMEISAIRIGQLSFVAAPYEMFGSHGSAIKEGSPYESTFVLGYCNGAYGYIPNAEAYDYGCYESHTGNFTRETGDELVQTYLSMLQELDR